MHHKRIYNLNQIEAACVIGTPLLAGILISHNYWVFSERQKSINWIFIGFFWTLALLGLGILIPEQFVAGSGIIIPIINGTILYPIINKLQGPQIDEHFRNNGEKGSGWVFSGLLLFVVAIITIPIILINKNIPTNNYIRKDFNSNGIYYNSKLPLDEVDKLGDILKRIEYFNSEAPVDVVFLDKDTVYVFKLIIEKSYFVDTNYINNNKRIFKHLESYNFRKPFTFKLIDPFLKDEKPIFLDNYDKIPIVLETEPFTMNSNFNLIYNKSVEKAEREKFQRFIVNMNKIFPTQKKQDFLLDIEDEKYILRLFIPMQIWNSSQLITELKYCKKSLNYFGFKYPFRLIIVDNNASEFKEMEIE